VDPFLRNDSCATTGRPLLSNSSINSKGERYLVCGSVRQPKIKVTPPVGSRYQKTGEGTAECAAVNSRVCELSIAL
jgi:hypothetical protein